MEVASGTDSSFLLAVGIPLNAFDQQAHPRWFDQDRKNVIPDALLQ